jgi:hypothetical protein
MGSPSTPAAPKYELAAQQTSAGNQNAAIYNQIGNMTNQKGVEQFELDPVTGAQKLGAEGKPISLKYTGVKYENPYATMDSQGSIPFDMSSLTQAQRDAYNAGKGLPKDFVKAYTPKQWTQESVLGGNDRTLYDQSQAAQLGLSGISLKGLEAVRAATDPTHPDYKKIDPSIAVQGGPATTAQNMTTSVGEPSLNYSIADAGIIQNDVDNNADTLNVNSGANAAAYGLGATGNTSGQLKTSLGIDPTLLNQQSTDALYRANTQYLDPQFTQGQAQLESKLANQGITRGSEAYNNAMLNFNNQKQQAYESARNQAIGQGTAAAQGLFGMGLQGAQFGNQALGQQFGQNVTAQQLANSAAGQNNELAIATQQANNAAKGQQFSQNLQQGNYVNAAQAQQYGQNANDAAFANSAEMQRIQTALQNANLSNEQKQQLYNQALQSAQLSNQASNQQLAQNQAIQQNPLNILQALRTGSQLNTANLPAVGVSQPAQLANWQGADFLGAATAQGQYDQGIYNAQAAANAQMISAGIGAAGALGGAGIGAAVKSDRRLKKNIKRIGTHVLGIGLYTWDYLWGEPFAGVMADEVEQVMPEAIVMHPSGFKMVNYSMLGLV